jgi:hypothetical protein
MPTAASLPYGSRPPPVTSALVVRGGARLGEVAVDGPAVRWVDGELSSSAQVRGFDLPADEGTTPVPVVR